ncbi:MAG: glutaredoxin domain-containing protein [Moraxellaceae bacterium]
MPSNTVKLPNRVKRLAQALLLLAASAPALAEVYKWVDANGAIQFSDKQPAKPQSKVEKVKIEVVTYSFVKTTPVKIPLPAAARGHVTLYGTPWCGYCKKARQYFQANNIPYRDLDVDSDSQAKEEWQQMGGRGVPVILVGQQRMDGFSPAGFRAIYR